jgi:hypothetical protein
MDVQKGGRQHDASADGAGSPPVLSYHAANRRYAFGGRASGMAIHQMRISLRFANFLGVRIRNVVGGSRCLGTAGTTTSLGDGWPLALDAADTKPFHSQHETEVGTRHRHHHACLQTKDGLGDRAPRNGTLRRSATNL